MKTTNPKIDRVLVFEPKSGATADEVMEVLKLFTFQTYPAELKTRENLRTLFDQLPENAKRHFNVIERK